MTAFIGGIGFTMLLLGGSCVDSQSMTVVVASLATCLVGIGLMAIADQMEKKRARRKRYKRI